MIIIAALNVPCPACKAASGERCVTTYNVYGSRVRRFMGGCHSERCYDAFGAQQMANALLDLDPTDNY